MIPALWQGRRSEPRRLLGILREPPWSLEAPPSFESPWNPLRVLPNLVEGALSAAGDLAGLLSWWCSSGLLEGPAGWLRVSGLTGPFGRAARGRQLRGRQAGREYLGGAAGPRGDNGCPGRRGFQQHTS